MIKKIVFKFAFLNKQVYRFKPIAKVLKFKRNLSGVLTDDDINSLFLGMVNLIKNNAIKKAEQFYKNEVVHYQKLLNLNLEKVVKLERELKRLKGKSM